MDVRTGAISPTDEKTAFVLETDRVVDDSLPCKSSVLLLPAEDTASGDITVTVDGYEYSCTVTGSRQAGREYVYSVVLSRGEGNTLCRKRRTSLPLPQ